MLIFQFYTPNQAAYLIRQKKKKIFFKLKKNK